MYIKDLDIGRKINEIRRLGSTYVNLQYMIRTVDWIQLNLQNRLRDRCSTVGGNQSQSTSQIPLTDVTVNRVAVTMSVWDHGSEDGDRVDIFLNGRLIRRNLKLKKAVTNIRLNLYSGVNNIEVRALNEGSSSPNTASMKITNVIKGRAQQKWRLKTGQSGKMRISVSY